MKGLTLYVCSACGEQFCMVQSSQRDSAGMRCPVCSSDVEEIIEEDEDE